MQFEGTDKAAHDDPRYMPGQIGISKTARVGFKWRIRDTKPETYPKHYLFDGRCTICGGPRDSDPEDGYGAYCKACNKDATEMDAAHQAGDHQYCDENFDGECYAGNRNMAKVIRQRRNIPQQDWPDAAAKIEQHIFNDHNISVSHPDDKPRFVPSDYTDIHNQLHDRPLRQKNKYGPYVCGTCGENVDTYAVGASYQWRHEDPKTGFETKTDCPNLQAKYTFKDIIPNHEHDGDPRLPQGMDIKTPPPPPPYKSRQVVPMNCPSCDSESTLGRYHKNGWREYVCSDCGNEFKTQKSKTAAYYRECDACTDDGEAACDYCDAPVNPGRVMCESCVANNPEHEWVGTTFGDENGLCTQCKGTGEVKYEPKTHRKNDPRFEAKTAAAQETCRHCGEPISLQWFERNDDHLWADEAGDDYCDKNDPGHILTPAWHEPSSPLNSDYDPRGFEHSETYKRMTHRKNEASIRLARTIKFHPQKWVNDYAVPADPRGETEWKPSAEHIRYMTQTHGEQAYKADSYESDEWRHDPAAPQWVKDWDGPFYLEHQPGDDPRFDKKSVRHPFDPRGFTCKNCGNDIHAIDLTKQMGTSIIPLDALTTTPVYGWVHTEGSGAIGVGNNYCPGQEDEHGSFPVEEYAMKAQPAQEWDKQSKTADINALNFLAPVIINAGAAALARSNHNNGLHANPKLKSNLSCPWCWHDKIKGRPAPNPALGLPRAVNQPGQGNARDGLWTRIDNLVDSGELRDVKFRRCRDCMDKDNDPRGFACDTCDSTGWMVEQPKEGHIYTQKWDEADPRADRHDLWSTMPIPTAEQAEFHMLQEHGYKDRRYEGWEPDSIVAHYRIMHSLDPEEQLDSRNQFVEQIEVGGRAAPVWRSKASVTGGRLLDDPRGFTCKHCGNPIMFSAKWETWRHGMDAAGILGQVACPGQGQPIDGASPLEDVDYRWSGKHQAHKWPSTHPANDPRGPQPGGREEIDGLDAEAIRQHMNTEHGQEIPEGGIPAIRQSLQGAPATQKQLSNDDAMQWMYEIIHGYTSDRLGATNQPYAMQTLEHLQQAHPDDYGYWDTFSPSERDSGFYDDVVHDHITQHVNMPLEIADGHEHGPGDPLHWRDEFDPRGPAWEKGAHEKEAGWMTLTDPCPTCKGDGCDQCGGSGFTPACAGCGQPAGYANGAWIHSKDGAPLNNCPRPAAKVAASWSDIPVGTDFTYQGERVHQEGCGKAMLSADKKVCPTCGKKDPGLIPCDQPHNVPDAHDFVHRHPHDPRGLASECLTCKQDLRSAVHGHCLRCTAPFSEPARTMRCPADHPYKCARKPVAWALVDKYSTDIRWVPYCQDHIDKAIKGGLNKLVINKHPSKYKVANDDYTHPTPRSEDGPDDTCAKCGGLIYTGLIEAAKEPWFDRDWFHALYAADEDHPAVPAGTKSRFQHDPRYKKDAATYYHVAPREDRESIEQHGIDYRGHSVRGDEDEYNGSDGRAANYLWKTQEAAENYTRDTSDLDVYEVTLPRKGMEKDPYFDVWPQDLEEYPGGAVRTTEPIHPSRVRRVARVAHVGDDGASHHSNPQEFRTEHPYFDECPDCVDGLGRDAKACGTCSGLGEAWDQEYWDGPQATFIEDFANYPNIRQVKPDDKFLREHVEGTHGQKDYEDPYTAHTNAHGMGNVIDPETAKIIFPDLQKAAHVGTDSFKHHGAIKCPDCAGTGGWFAQNDPRFDRESPRLHRRSGCFRCKGAGILLKCPNCVDGIIAHRENHSDERECENKAKLYPDVYSYPDHCCRCGSCWASDGTVPGYIDLGTATGGAGWFETHMNHPNMQNPLGGPKTP